jgi:hypothetical protein
MWGFGGVAPKKNAVCHRRMVSSARACDVRANAVSVCRCRCRVRWFLVVLCPLPPPRRRRLPRDMYTVACIRGLFWTPCAPRPPFRGRRDPNRNRGAQHHSRNLAGMTSTRTPGRKASYKQVLPLFTVGFGRLMALRTRGDAKIGVSIHQNLTGLVPDRLSGLKVPDFRFFRPHIISLHLG